MFSCISSVFSLLLRFTPVLFPFFLSAGNIFGLNLDPVLVGRLWLYAFFQGCRYESVLARIYFCCLMRVRIRNRYGSGPDPGVLVQL